MSHPTFSKYIATGGPKALYHAPASESYMCCIKTTAFLTGNWLVDCNEMHQRKYCTVYENKVEYADVIPCCCCCMVDYTGTTYFDRPLTDDAARAACCKPCCTHCSFFPTCCDACGEGVVMYGQGCFACKRTMPAGMRCTVPCRSWVMLCGFDEGDRLAAEINNARNAFRASGTATVRVAPAEVQAMKR